MILCPNCCRCVLEIYVVHQLHKEFDVLAMIEEQQQWLGNEPVTRGPALRDNSGVIHCKSKGGDFPFDVATRGAMVSVYDAKATRVEDRFNIMWMIAEADPPTQNPHQPPPQHDPGYTLVDCAVRARFMGPALYAHALDQNLEQLQVLLSADGAAQGINHATTSGATPLMMAVRNGDYRCAKLLLSHGADLLISKNDGTSCISMAASKGDVEMVEILLQHSADLTQCTHDGSSSLFFAAQAGHSSIAGLLLRHRADPNQTRQDGASSLFMAAYNRHSATVEVLLSAGARPNHCMNGANPLFHSANHGDACTVELLLRHHADANEVVSGSTCLFIAVQGGHQDVVRLLLANNADPNQAEHGSPFALYMAAYNGDLAIADMLVGFQADVNMSFQGWTPLEIAQRFGHAEIEDMLQACATKSEKLEY